METKKELIKRFKSHRHVFAVMIAVYAFYVGGFLNNPMTNAIADLTVAIVDDHALNVDDYAGNSVDLSQHDGKIYSGMPPGLSAIMLPSYVLLKPILKIVGQGRIDRLSATIERAMKGKFGQITRAKNRAGIAILLIFTTFLFGIPAVIVLSLQFARVAEELYGLKRAHTNVALAVLLLISPFADFTSTIYHTLFATVFLFMVISSTYLNWRKQRSAGHLVVSGMALGMLFALDYPTVVYALIAMAYLVASLPARSRAQNALITFAAFALPVVLTLIYHWKAFGSPFTTSYQLRITENHHLIVEEFRERGRWMIVPTAYKIWRAFLHSSCGTLFYNPFLPFGLIAALVTAKRIKGRREKLFWITSSLIMAANLWYYSTLPRAIPPNVGSFGARYTLYSVPFGLLALIPVARWLVMRSAPALAALLALIACPTWIYLWYGSPNRPLAEYIDLFKSRGPSSYLLMKLFDAHWVSTPALGYILTVFLISMCTVLWISLKPRNA